MKNFSRKSVFLTMIFLLMLTLTSQAQRAPLNFFNADSLENINLDLRNDKYGKISSLLVYHGSRLIYEKYYGFNQASTLHPISSVTKSVTSIALGICIDRGYIESLDEKIYCYFPEYSHIFEEDTLKKLITIRHLLNQTSGFKWDEWSIHYSYAGNPLIELSQQNRNWIPEILKLPLDSIPGNKFSYNSACSELVKEIITRSSCQDFEIFIADNIIKKLDITTYHWDNYPKNSVPAWGGLSLTTRNMARLGLLVLNNGTWNNQRIVSQDWIKNSLTATTGNDIIMYGYHWWVTKQPDGNPLYFAAGYGDQYVFIAPDKNLVVAFNGKNFTDHKWEKDQNDLITKILNAFVK